MRDQMKEQFKKTKKIIISKTSKKDGRPPGRSILSQAVLALIIFLILTSAYSFLTGFSDKTEEISLSELASEITLGNVSEVLITGDKLDVTYFDGAKKIS